MALELEKLFSELKVLQQVVKTESSNAQGKLLVGIVDVLEKLAEETQTIGADVDDAADVIAELEDAVTELEEEVFGEDGEFGEDDFYEVICPKCKNSLTLDFGILSQETVTCPQCGAELEFDFEEEEGGCDCGCDHDHYHKH